MTCRDCGREPEGGIQTHYIGCTQGQAQLASGEDRTTKDATLIAPAAQDTCAKDGCVGPRAPQGKGPRPKYCVEHKTGGK